MITNLQPKRYLQFMSIKMIFVRKVIVFQSSKNNCEQKKNKLLIKILSASQIAKSNSPFTKVYFYI